MYDIPLQGHALFMRNVSVWVILSALGFSRYISLVSRGLYFPGCLPKTGLSKLMMSTEIWQMERGEKYLSAVLSQEKKTSMRRSRL